MSLPGGARAARKRNDMAVSFHPAIAHSMRIHRRLRNSDRFPAPRRQRGDEAAASPSSLAEDKNSLPPPANEAKMAQGRFEVTYKESDATRVPDQLTEGAALLMDLARHGVVAQVGKRLHIRRQGGYSGLDVFLSLLVFFSATATKGLRPFFEKHGEHLRRIAALAGRRRMPSPASVSRALNSVEVDLLRDEGAATWLLAGVGGIDKVLLHPSAVTRDTLGQGWHVFDLDPTVTTLRHRALPEGDGLPEPRLRSQDTGAPGHAGRKRGDLQFRRVTVQHAGSGAWLHAHLSPGNGDGLIDCERALDTIVATRERLKLSSGRMVVRMDGEYGQVPVYAALRERELPFITRVNRPQLYQDPAFLSLLRTATWYRVESSGAEPRRAAADLGVMQINPGKRTRRPDGSRYAPISIRVVATIFPKSGDAKKGATVDGWQVELFAVDVPADAWPAAEAISMYFGHAAQENRFAQEDRELGLDRIISYHLPGQELATIAGLSLWNLRLVRGFELATPPLERPRQRWRRPIVDQRVPKNWPRDPVLHDILGTVDFEPWLAKRPGWRFDFATAELICEDGRPLTLSRVRPEESTPGRTTIIFRRPNGGCEECAFRTGCLHSTRDGASKHSEITVPTDIAEQLRERLALTRDPSAAPTVPTPINAGPSAMQSSLFLPAAARHEFAAVFLGATLHIKVVLPPDDETRPRLVAANDADRQRRRKTWAQNVDRYALPDDARVIVNVAGSAALHAMFGATPPKPGTVGARLA
jgi:hypothetical protein